MSENAGIRCRPAVVGSVTIGIIIPRRGATEDERTPPLIPPQAGGEASNSRKRGEKQATAANGGRSKQQPQARGEASNSRKRGEKQATAANGGRSKQQPQAGGEGASFSASTKLLDGYFLRNYNVLPTTIASQRRTISHSRTACKTQSQYPTRRSCGTFTHLTKF